MPREKQTGSDWLLGHYLTAFHQFYWVLTRVGKIRTHPRSQKWNDGQDRHKASHSTRIEVLNACEMLHNPQRMKRTTGDHVVPINQLKESKGNDQQKVMMMERFHKLMMEKGLRHNIPSFPSASSAMFIVSS
jgi:hypothetical protein